MHSLTAFGFAHIAIIAIGALLLVLSTFFTRPWPYAEWVKAAFWILGVAGVTWATIRFVLLFGDSSLSRQMHHFLYVTQLVLLGIAFGILALFFVSGEAVRGIRRWRELKEQDRVIYDLPPKLSELRLICARSHNRRVLLLTAILCIVLVAGLLSTHTRDGLIAVVALAGAVEIIGFVVVIRRAKQQSVELGFACPICHGALYDGRANRLRFRGECPQCKRFVIDLLAQMSSNQALERTAGRCDD